MFENTDEELTVNQSPAPEEARGGDGNVVAPQPCSRNANSRGEDAKQATFRKMKNNSLICRIEPHGNLLAPQHGNMVAPFSVDNRPN